MRLTGLVLAFFSQASPPATLDRFSEYGTIGLLLWLIGEKVVPFLSELIRGRAKQEEGQANRTQTLEARQVSAWEQVAMSNQKLADSNRDLAVAITGFSQMLGRVEESTIETKGNMATLLERTAGCELRGRARRKTTTEKEAV